MLLVFAFKEWPIQRELRELRGWANQIQRGQRGRATASRIDGQQGYGQDPGYPAVARATRLAIGRGRRQPGSSADEDRGAREHLAALRRPLPPRPGEVLRPLRLDHVLQHEPGARRSPGSGHPSSGGARRRPARPARPPRRTATGRSTTGWPSARPARDRRGTPSASGGSRRTPSGHRAAAPWPPRASPPPSRRRTESPRTRRTPGRNCRPAKGISQTSACTSGTVDAGPAGGRDARAPASRRTGRTPPPSRPARARYRAHGADPQPTSRIRRPRDVAEQVRRPIPAGSPGTRPGRRRPGTRRARRDRRRRRRPTSAGSRPARPPDPRPVCVAGSVR